MASACVNNIGMSTDNFLDCPPAKYPSYGWLSPRISFGREFPEEEASRSRGTRSSLSSNGIDAKKPEEPDPEISGKDFEFRLEDPVTMLPADELFFDGKLVPLQVSTIRHSAPASSEVGTADAPPNFRRRNEISSAADPYLFSPKAPRCSSRWKELLGLKKLYQNKHSSELVEQKTSSHSTTNRNAATRGLKHFLHRSSKSDTSLTLPLLKDSENESASISARLLLSSSSSGHEHDDLPRLSLDSDKPSTRNTSNLSRVRLVKHRSTLSSENAVAATRVGRSSMRRAQESSTVKPVRGVSVDSPRMNSYGKIVFHSLERSSSSPSSFNGGPRHKHRGMERSYSANIRITPVLNVPVCSLRGSSMSGVFGFPLFSSQQKKENGGGVGGNRNQQNHGKNRTERN